MPQKSVADSHEQVIPVIEESLEIGRRVVETGAVRVRKVVQDVRGPLREPLTSEHVDIERVPIGRVLQEPAVVRQEGDVTIVPVVEERLVLRKELVLVEEIHLTRRREVHESSEEVTLRRESAVVERLDPQSRQWLPEQD